MLGSRSEMMDKLKTLQSAKSTLIKELAIAVTENEKLKIENKQLKASAKKKTKTPKAKVGLPVKKKTTKKKG